MQSLVDMFVGVFRLTITTSCTLDLRRFPHDTQLCTLALESCKYYIIKKANKNKQLLYIVNLQRWATLTMPALITP